MGRKKRKRQSINKSPEMSDLPNYDRVTIPPEEALEAEYYFRDGKCFELFHITFLHISYRI